MTKKLQYGLIVLSFALGIFANLYYKGQTDLSTAGQLSQSAVLLPLIPEQNAKLTSQHYKSLQNEQSAPALENFSVGQLDSDNYLQQKVTIWQEEKERIKAELFLKKQEYRKLDARYQNAKARREALKRAPSTIDNRLIGTSFELLQKELSAEEWLDYKAFKDEVDTSAYSYELQILLSDYFILQVDTSVTRLHTIECKEYVCFIHLYSNAVMESLETLQAIDEITDDYTLELRRFKNFFIEKGAYGNEDYLHAILIVIAAQKT